MIRIAVVVWLVVVAAGTVALSRYKLGAGQAAAAPLTWPESSTIRRDTERPTLVLFAHPRCPCTRASFTELAKLATRMGPAVSLRVLFLRPPDVGPEWESSDLWDKARAIPGAEIAVDEGGREARRFGTFTSGQVLLYDAGGDLRFEGGVTVARGHEGDSPAAARIESLVAGSSRELANAPVFGCPLQEVAP